MVWNGRDMASCCSHSGRHSPDAGLASVSTRAVPAFDTNRREVALRA